MASTAKIINTALTGLSARQREVLENRFGLKGGEGETLAAIGERMNITRERVRQIENAALAVAKTNISKDEEALVLLDRVKQYITGRGGVAKKTEVVEFADSIAKGIGENQIDFLSEASAAFNVYREDEDYHPFYYVTDRDLRNAQAFVEGWANFLKSKKEAALPGAAYRTELASFSKAKSLESSAAESYLSVTKLISANRYGDVGLREWPEINPNTIRDKIYLVLKKGGEPLHFEDIAKKINEVKFDGQVALAPTVHNELIKDERFVLVGRGMYGLKEHGYEPGTAREVIAKVLKGNGPLKATDVVSRVNEQRFFKENTILINLQNKSAFERLPDGRYRVREA
ncbi:MAG TPA: sigma factor-like helix-turn-helix DNA-binding protein [Candidatus Paceibacterota bacterium]|nr:sigma factor-like helix-turn-helix DNA-binding protein [Candidatus Paceibacterota bacterium]